jgi:hypothetical protein
VTEAHRPLSEDVGYRQRRYLVSMGIRTACVLIAVLLAGHVPVWALLFPIIGAVILPYIAVVFANGGREPENSPQLHDDDWQSAGQLGDGTPSEGWERTNQKGISGPHPEIRS